MDWTNTNSSIGLGNSGTGNIASFNGTNPGSSVIAGVITVTPSANLCVGVPTDFTITVNPIPTVNAISSGTYCSGASVAATTFTGNSSATTYNWSNTNSSIGLAASGIGNIASFTSVNNGAVSVNGVITATPSLNSCVGTPQNFTITVNPVPVAPTVPAATICPGSSATLTAIAPGGTYTWYDALVAGNLLATNPTYTTPALNTTTNYFVKTTNAFGCISPLTQVSVTVLNFLAVSASPNQTICIGANATLTATPTGATFTYAWDEPANAGFSNNASVVVTPTITTNYTVNVTSSNGCTGTAQTQVLVNNLPNANAGNAIAFCNGQSGTIGSASVSGYSYSWQPTTGLSNATIANPTVILANTGTTPSLNDYTLTVTQNGCIANNTVQVTVNPLPVSNAGASLTLCATQTGSIGTASTNGYTYSWSPGTNLSSTSVSDPTVNGVNLSLVATTINYTVTTTETATSCQSNDDVSVTVLPYPTVNAGLVATSCAGTTNLPLNGIAGGAISGVTWSGGSGSFSPNNTTAIAIYNPSTADYTSGSVTLTLTAAGITPCPNVNSPVTINFYQNPVINFTAINPKGCPEHCVNFKDQSALAQPEFIDSWLWNFGDGGSSNVQGPTHCYTQSGIYSVTLTATSNHFCSSTLTIPQIIEVYPMPEASFIPSPQSAGILDPNITFQNTSTGDSISIWNFGDQFALGSTNTSTLTNPSHAYTNAGEYTVNLLIISNKGCEDRAAVTVEILPEFTFYIPNAFTPNNSDGINDIFTGMGIGIDKYEMWVFDRWGEKIYYTDDIHKGWDGRRLGKSDVVQQDVYIWKVKLKDVFARNHEYIGHVTLLK